MRKTQADLIKALAAWEKTAAPRASSNFTSLDGLKSSLKTASQSLISHDESGARQALSDFQNQWTTHEALVRSLNQEVYSQIEFLTGHARRALQDPVDSSAALAAFNEMTRQMDSLQPPKAYSAWDAGIILFREGLEALLVLAALLAFLARTDQRSRVPWVWSGAALGLGASVAVAVLVSVVMTGWLASSTPELVEGLTGLAAVALMLTVGAWLHGKAAVKNWNQWLKERINRAGNSGWALGVLAFLAVLREGAETVVFLWGMAGALPVADLLIGIAGGLAVLAVLGIVMIGFSKRLPLQVFFPLATVLFISSRSRSSDKALVRFSRQGGCPQRL